MYRFETKCEAKEIAIKYKVTLNTVTPRQVRGLNRNPAATIANTKKTKAGLVGRPSVMNAKAVAKNTSNGTEMVAKA